MAKRDKSIPDDAICVHCGDFAGLWRDETGYECKECFRELVFGRIPHVCKITAGKEQYERRTDLREESPLFDDVIRAMEEDR